MYAKVPIIGSGVPFKDPYRALFPTKDWSAIIVTGEDGHPVSNDCIVYTPQRSVPGVLAIADADAKAEISVRDPKIDTKELDKRSVADILVPGLLMASKVPISRRMLFAGAAALGVSMALPRFARANAIPLFGDDFNRSNGALGSNWQGGYATDLTIVSNVVRTSVVTSNESDGTYVNLIPANQWASLQIPTWPTAGNPKYIWLMLRATAPATVTWYQFTASRDDPAQGVHISKKIAGVETTLAVSTTAPTPWTAGDTLYGEVVGTNLAIYRNGTSLLTASDSAISGVGLAGFGAYIATGTAAEIEADNFMCGKISIPGLTLLGVE